MPGAQRALVEVTDSGSGMPNRSCRSHLRRGIQRQRRYAGAGTCGVQTADDLAQRGDSRFQPGKQRNDFQLGFPTL